MAATVRKDLSFKSGDELIQVLLIEPLSLGNLTFSGLTPTSAIEFQDKGVMLDMNPTTPNITYRIFVPYSNIKGIFQEQP
jgi:hypothetical protein